jgi:hypothetical protein
MNKDWTGNSKTTFVQLGANNHSEHDYAEHSFYSTDPHTLEIFLEALKRDNFFLHRFIWECACGMGHLSEVLKKEDYTVVSTDLIDRGYGIPEIDFLKIKSQEDGLLLDMDILTNPPYKYAQEFVEHALEILQDGYHCVMLLKIQFLEGKARRKLFDKNPPKYVYVNSERQACYMNGDMSKKMSSAACYCWYIWEKGYKGETIVRWI